MSDEKCTELSETEIQFACKTFCKWMNVCEDNNRGISSADVDHSALLRRLLGGGKLHENPPPLRMSYPAWELVEQDEIEIVELFEDEEDLVVDQHRGYRWIDKEKKILEYTRLGIRYEYIERESLPRWVKKGLNPKDYKYIGKFLKRLNDPLSGKEVSK